MFRLRQSSCQTRYVVRRLYVCSGTDKSRPIPNSGLSFSASSFGCKEMFDEMSIEHFVGEITVVKILAQHLFDS